MRNADDPKSLLRRYMSSRQSKIDFLFDHLLLQVDRLFRNPNWLPIETCQISFYSERLSSLSIAFHSFTITDEDFRYQLLDNVSLSLLVNNLISPEMSSVYHLDLTLVGDQLASDVALIYKACMKDLGKAEEFDHQYFASQFYFDRKNFQEQCGEEVFVGFHEEARNLLKQLACIRKKQLQVISIVGMAGLCKTTLARRLYNDPYVVSYFYVQAWVTCSQAYVKRDLLLGILRSVVEINDEVCRMNNEMLALVLYRALKGRRYLIVIDDLWSSKAWDDFKSSFPDDNNGSKIMLTTRLKDVALHAQSDGNPLCLRFLTEVESFDLFRRKTLIAGKFFDEFSFIGKMITRKCHGLPLAIVVIAGLLKNNYELDWWAHVAESVSSYIVTDVNQYIDTLALSYNHLPQHLRPCLLYFGAFPEDHDIPARKLTMLWIAEGFIHQDSTEKSLEDVAEDYLMDLVRRSLIVVSNSGLDGAIKTCRVHDLLHDLCLRKAKEDNFSPNTYVHIKPSYLCAFCSASGVSLTRSPVSLSTSVLDITSLCFCASSSTYYSLFKDISMNWNTSKAIRALDISSIELLEFPNHVTRKPYSAMSTTPNLRKLGLCGALTTRSGDLKCPDIDFLAHLKTLKLFNTIPMSKAGRLSSSILFPRSLRKLTVSNLYLHWKEAWVFELIPNLEVLKLKFHAFVGKGWETSPKAFPCLKFLRFHELDLETWTASHDHFPVLQRLQVYRCPYLMEIPEDFGNICTLEWIELSECSDAASNSARDIREVQESFGNDWPKILLNPRV
ncbi:putative late blight resistance protein homolog R1C-3 [Daucus carota subsp. sativus]